MEFWDDIEFFSADEFTCQCGCGDNGMKHSFMLQLDGFRKHCGFPFTISSGYRCPAHNDNVSSTGLNGPHTTGRAADIAVQGEDAHTLLMDLHRAGFTGVGVNQKGSGRFIHLDMLDATAGRPLRL